MIAKNAGRDWLIIWMNEMIYHALAPRSSVWIRTGRTDALDALEELQRLARELA